MAIPWQISSWYLLSDGVNVTVLVLIPGDLKYLVKSFELNQGAPMRLKGVGVPLPSLILVASSKPRPG